MEIEEKNIAIDPTCADNLALRNHKVEISSSADNNEEEITCSAANWKRQKLFLEIPTTKIMDIKPKRVNFVLTPNSSGSDMKSHELGATASASNASSAGSSVIKGQGQGQGRSSSGLKSLLPKLGFVYRSSSDVEKASCDVPFTTLGDQMSSIPRSTSLTKLFTPRIGRTSSLPLDNPASIIPNTTGSLHPSANGAQMHEAQVHISRSVSAPLNKELKLKRTDSFIRVIPSPKVKARELQIPSANEPVDTEADTEDIPEEDAVCRICMVELCEGGETLKMECSCKGELALAHQECAVKWFSIKGNKTCDICKQDVTNLPVTLLRIQSTRAANSATTRAQMIDINDYRAWQEVPILVIVSMLAYFCFLEQLLVARMGTNAIAISLPFSCVLGLLSSMTSSTMVTKRFVWIYASLQFSLVVIFGHIFYSVVHLQAIISILLATFVGYGTAMSGSSITVEFLRWRRRNTQQRARQDPQMAVANNQHDQNSENPEMLV